MFSLTKARNEDLGQHEITKNNSSYLHEEISLAAWQLCHPTTYLQPKERNPTALQLKECALIPIWAGENPAETNE